MRVIDKRSKVTRRRVLGAGVASLVALTITPGGMIVGAGNAWAATAKGLKPNTFATLLQMARDIYPHDHVADKHYAGVVSSFDDAATKGEGDKALFEDGVTALDAAAVKAHGTPYAEIGWETQRVALLREVENDPFFQRVRGALVGGLYGNAEVWPLFGYEGPSAPKGGYINRGFDDIDWL